MTLQLRYLNSDDNCTYCLESMTGTTTVGHIPKNTQAKHCFHKECFLWDAQTVQKVSCAICREEINNQNPIESCTERCIKELKFIAQDALTGAAIGGATIATPFITVAVGQYAGVAGGAAIMVGVLGSDIENRTSLILTGAAALTASVTASASLVSAEKILTSGLGMSVGTIGTSIILGAVGSLVLRGIIARQLKL